MSLTPVTTSASIYTQVSYKLRSGQAEGESTPLLEKTILGTFSRATKELNARAQRTGTSHILQAIILPQGEDDIRCSNLNQTNFYPSNQDSSLPCEIHQAANNTHHSYRHVSQPSRSEDHIKTLLTPFHLNKQPLEWLFTLRQPTPLTAFRS
ncbi:hypothetical protein MA16_Dca019231 [Dendrobium catenatum]|uniref:Uncharacterized protein n=1 Tax=Dendrobium catenatum TaxID=906689 RepID=A0A2I0W1L6_9ASPA|nr:hypothetical protein MA16_Dca019231 [Dendrobium catenatum]